VIDTSAKSLYTSIWRMKLACETLSLEIDALKEQLQNAILQSAPRAVRAVAYEATCASTARLTEMESINRIADLTFQIGERERDLLTQETAYEDAMRLLRRTAKRLETEGLTSTIFIKSFIEGKALETVRTELGVSVQTVSYHKTKIYNMLDIQ